jgi:DNA polymerase III subunit beta
MKLQTQSSRALCGALQKSAKGVGGKSMIAILDHVLLSRRDDGKYMFTTATSDSQLRLPAPLVEIDAKLDKPLALPIGILTQFLATLPDCVVTFNFNSESTFLLEYCTGDGDKVKSGKAQFAYMSGDDFPTMVKPEAGSTHLALPYAVFDGALKQAMPFIKNDELRPVMSSLLIDIAEDLSNITFVGTNGHMLYKQTYCNDPERGGSNFYRGGEARQMKMNNAFFRTLSAFDGQADIDIESDGHIIRFSSGDMDFLCKEVEAKYPNYNSVIPRNNPFYVTFSKKEMLSIVKRVALFTSENSNIVKVEKNGMFIDVSTEDKDFSQGAHDQVIIADAECTDGFKIGFNASVLQTSVNAIQGDTVRMQLSDASRAAVLTADEPSPCALALCMPTVLGD